MSTWKFHTDDSVFEPFRISKKNKESVEEPSYIQLIVPMLIYVACQVLVSVTILVYCIIAGADVVFRLMLGLYKCKSMGILPTGSADWLQFETRGDVSSVSRCISVAHESTASRVVGSARCLIGIVARARWRGSTV
jgi:hypothetical protein